MEGRKLTKTSNLVLCHSGERPSCLKALFFFQYGVEPHVYLIGSVAAAFAQECYSDSVIVPLSSKEAVVLILLQVNLRPWG